MWFFSPAAIKRTWDASGVMFKLVSVLALLAMILLITASVFAMRDVTSDAWYQVAVVSLIAEMVLVFVAAVDLVSVGGRKPNPQPSEAGAEPADTAPGSQITDDIEGV